jgi:hypothetical protein
MLFQTVFFQDRAALTAVDSLKRDKELRTFLTALHEAAISRDTVKLFPLIDEIVEVEPMWMDGVYASGKQQFIEFWKLKNKKDSSVLWQILSDVSQMEGSYRGGYYGREGLYSIPSYEQKFEQSAWLVLKDSLPVYSSKSTKSTIVRWLPKGAVVRPWPEMNGFKQLRYISRVGICLLLISKVSGDCQVFQDLNISILSTIETRVLLLLFSENVSASICVPLRPSAGDI